MSLTLEFVLFSISSSKSIKSKMLFFNLFKSVVLPEPLKPQINIFIISLLSYYNRYSGGIKMDLIVYEKDCEKLDLDRPRLEMLKKEAFDLAVIVDRVILVLENKCVLELKNSYKVKNFNLILKD